MSGIMRDMIVFICCMMFATSKAFQCDVCDCLVDQKTVRCANLGLRFTPELKTVNSEVFDYVDLRGNRLTFVDFSGLVKFRIVNLLDNPISCEHGLINTDLISSWNEIFINCELPMVKTTQKPTTQNPTQKTVTVISTPDITVFDKDTIAGIGGLFGDASAYTKGKLEVAWGLSATMTIFGIIGGLISCVTMCKILQKLKLIDRRMIHAADFEAPAPDSNRFELFEDISNTVRNVFTIPRNSRISPSSQSETNCSDNHDEPRQDYIQVPNQRNMYFECFGGEPSDDEEVDPVIIRPARLRPPMFMNTDALTADLDNFSLHDNDDYREAISYDTDSEEDN